MSSTATALRASQFLDSEQDSRLRGNRRKAIGLAVVLLWVGAFGLLSARQWQSLNQSERLLSASLAAQTVADYSAKRPAVKIGRVRLAVIADMVRDSQPEAADLKIRVASIPVLLNSAIPGDTSPAPTQVAELRRPILYFDDPVPEAAALGSKKTNASTVSSKSNSPQSSQASSPTTGQPTAPSVNPAPATTPAEKPSPVAPGKGKDSKKNHHHDVKKESGPFKNETKRGPGPSNKENQSGNGGSRGQSQKQGKSMGRK